MIVRISAEGQFELDDDCQHRLNELDNEAVAAAEAHDEERFRRIWQQMLDLVERDGKPIPNDELVASDVILPPRDVSIEEAQREFTGDGRTAHLPQRSRALSFMVADAVAVRHAEIRHDARRKAAAVRALRADAMQIQAIGNQMTARGF